MGVLFADAEKALDDGVKQLFGSDPRIQSVGIGHHGDGYGFRVVKNAAKILPLSASIGPPLSHIGNVPITIVNSHAELRHLVKVPASGPGSPALPVSSRNKGSIIPSSAVSRSRISMMISGREISRTVSSSSERSGVSCGQPRERMRSFRTITWSRGKIEE